MTDLAALTSCPAPMWKAAQLIYFGGSTMVLGASRGAGSVNLAVGWNPRFFTASFPHFLFAAGMSIVRANNSHYWTLSASLRWKEESHLLVSSSLHLLTIANGQSSTFFFVFLFASLYKFSRCLLLRKQHPLLGMWDSPPSKGTIATATSWWPRRSLSNCWTSPILSNSLFFRPTNCSVFIFRHHHHHNDQGQGWNLANQRCLINQSRSPATSSRSNQSPSSSSSSNQSGRILIFFLPSFIPSNVSRSKMLLPQVKKRFRISPGDGSCPWRTNPDLEF